MATITTEIKNAIVREIEDELNDRSYEYNTSHLNKIVDEWFQRKNSLIDLFSKHPLWNPEKFMIQFDTDFERRICTDEIHNFVYWIQQNAGIEFSYYKTQQQREWYVCEFIRKIERQFFDESMQTQIDEVNNLNEKYKLRANMKASKAIGKICREEGWDKFPEYNQKYAALCDCLSPIKVKRHTVISLNPLDYLLMSNGNSWTSCHYIGKYPSDSGCYSSGTISYMLDEHSFIFYTVDASFDGKDIELEPKLQRQVFGYNDEVLVQLRLYPSANDRGAEQIYEDIRAIVQKVIADCLEQPNIWVKSKKQAEDVAKLGVEATCYPDWRNGNSGRLCTVSYFKERKNGEDFSKIVFGAEPICISCGQRHPYGENISCCENYDDYYICEHCGERIYEDDVYWCGDYSYCGDCVSFCDECEEWVPNDEIHLVDGNHVCDYCLDNSSSIYRCENCDEYHYDENMIDVDGCYYCKSCIENNEEIKECECCGEYHHEEYMKKVDGEWICDSCINYNDEICECSKCGRLHFVDNMKEVYINKDTVDTEYVCERCIKSDEFGLCCDCKEYHYMKNMTTDECGNLYCDDCKPTTVETETVDVKTETPKEMLDKTYDITFVCKKCNKTLSTEGYLIHDKDTGYSYCKNCYDDILIEKEK